MNVELFVVVTPVYEDEASARRLFQELGAAFGDRLYLVAVDDGSLREPVTTAWFADAGVHGTVLTLAHNLGHQKAIATGLCYAAEHFPHVPVIVMDSDGEDLPVSIHALLASTAGADVVFAQRKNRIESRGFKFFYACYKRLFYVLSGRRISFGNFALYSPRAVARLSRMASLWIHVAATVLSSRLSIAYVPIDRGARYAGSSKMNFVGLALHGFKSLMVFAEDVLVRVGIFCTAVAALAGVGTCLAILLKLIGLSSPGWFSVIIGVLLLIMFQTGMLALTMLLLTGVMKGVLSAPPDYRSVIAGIQTYHD